MADYVIIDTMSRWDNNDKIKLMEMYASGNSYEEIGKVLDRSPNAIKLRLESIIYDNLVKGKKVSLLTKMLNTNVDTIKQFYYSHKSFKKGKGEEVVDVDFNDADLNNVDKMVDNMLGGSSRRNFGLNTRHIARSKEAEITKIDPVKTESGIKSGIKSKSDKVLKNVEEENHVLEEIVKNYKMKRLVKKLYVDGKLDEKSTIMYEKLLMKNTSRANSQ